MKSGNKPSIFSDRSGIGSPAELDEYGVWVKIEPEEVGNDDVSGFDAGVFDEEPKSEAVAENFSDFDLDADDAAKSDDDGNFDFGTDDFADSLDFDETENTETGFAGAAEDAPLEPTADVEAETGAESDNLDLPSFDIDDLLPEEPENSEAQETETDFTFADEPQVPPVAQPVDLSADTPMEPAAALPDSPVFDDEPAAEPLAAEGGEDSGDGIEREFDDIPSDAPFEAITIDEINSAPVINDVIDDSVKPSTQRDEAPPHGGLETELLLKIANELSSIKTELTTLKNEVSTMQKTGVPPQANSPVPEPEEAQSEPEGFFDDSDEDEKIALTGDELDNIINTSDEDEKIALTGDELDNIINTSDEDEKIALTGDELDNIINTSDITEEKTIGDEPDDIIDTSDITEEKAIGDESAIPGDEPDTLTGSETLSDDELAGIIDNAELIEETGISADEELAKLADEGFDAMPQASPEEDITVDLQLEEPQAADEIPDFSFDAPEEQHEEMEIPSIDDVLSSVADENDAEESSGNDVPFVRVDLASDKYSLENVFDGIDEIPEETEFSDPAEAADAVEPAGEADLDETVMDEVATNEPVIDEAPVDEPVMDEAVIDEPVGDEAPVDETVSDETPVDDTPKTTGTGEDKFKNEIRTVLAYMDQLLESLPEEKIEEFARSDKFEIYKKVFKDLGLV
jgi:hypothetical protein